MSHTKNNPIPANETSWGIARVVYEETYQRILKINEEASADETNTVATEFKGIRQSLCIAKCAAD